MEEIVHSRVPVYFDGQLHASARIEYGESDETRTRMTIKNVLITVESARE